MRNLRHGLTLIELVITLAIAAVLALAAAPFLGDYVANSRLREAGNTLQAQALLGQSEARKRNLPVRVRVAGGTISLLDMSAGEPGVVFRELALSPPLAAAVDTNLDFGSDGRLRPPGAGVPPPDLVAINLVMAGSVCSADRRCPGLRVDAGGSIRLCGDTTQACN
jgi:type IV fimbrial biogenesis protein FimT